MNRPWKPIPPIDSRPQPGQIPAAPGAAQYWISRWRSDGGGITLGRDDTINLWPMPDREPSRKHALELAGNPALAQAVRIFIRSQSRKLAAKRRGE